MWINRGLVTLVVLRGTRMNCLSADTRLTKAGIGSIGLAGRLVSMPRPSVLIDLISKRLIEWKAQQFSLYLPASPPPPPTHTLLVWTREGA